MPNNPPAKPRRISLYAILLPFFMAACAPTAEQQADYNAVARSGVSSAIYDKMEHGDSLSLYDIVSLSRAHVSDAIIIRYIRDHGTIYYLGPQDIDYLRNSGVSQSVIDYMAQTAPPPPGPGGVYVVPPPIGIGVVFGPGWHCH